MNIDRQTIETDILIIGGGTAGCYSAITIAEQNKGIKVLIAEKANIIRSGCLAAGVNALNAYINEGETPESYVEYVKKESEGVIREDLIYSMAKGLNKVTQKIEGLGLTILKDKYGKYVPRGKRSIKINGENIKTILADQVLKQKDVTVLNKVNIIDYIVKNDEIIGAIGFSVDEHIFYTIYAKAVICTTGGAAGIYRPNNTGFSKHKMWYSPFNTGAGYAMGIRAGAEMTSFEMRFIALRCKDTIAPTGTIAQGVGAEQINSKGEEYVQKYGKPLTTTRLFSTVQENNIGQGPCYLKTKGISKEQEEELFKAYLNMAPAQALKWIENGSGPKDDNVEIEGTEPYIVGGHTSSGYWVDANRATTIKGLYAAGDVAGGSPKKYVTGCFVEGEIAALASLEYISDKKIEVLGNKEVEARIEEVLNFLNRDSAIFTPVLVEEAMQKVMDEYAGGIATSYVYNTKRLEIAARRIDELLEISNTLKADDMHELMFIYEIIDRLYVAKVLIVHLLNRKETRWPCYEQNADYKDKDDRNFLKYINTRFEKGEVKVIVRDLVRKEEIYEHKN